MENTMIQIKKETASKLKDLKKYERETYDEIINTLITELKEHIQEQNLELNEETRMKLDDKTPISKYIDQETVRKELLT